MSAAADFLLRDCRMASVGVVPGLSNAPRDVLSSGFTHEDGARDSVAWLPRGQLGPALRSDSGTCRRSPCFTASDREPGLLTSPGPLRLRHRQGPAACSAHARWLGHPWGWPGPPPASARSGSLSPTRVHSPLAQGLLPGRADEAPCPVGARGRGPPPRWPCRPWEPALITPALDLQ